MPPRIVVFSCQWAPHYAFQSLYRRGVRGEGDGVRVLTACVGHCPQEAIRLQPRSCGIPLAEVRAALCTLCGRCLAVCPVGAPDAPLAGHRPIRAALAAAFAGERT